MLFSCSTAGSWTREQSSSLPVLESSSLVLVLRQCSCSEEGCKRGEFYQELMVYTGDVRIHNILPKSIKNNIFSWSCGFVWSQYCFWILCNVGELIVDKRDIVDDDDNYVAGRHDVFCRTIHLHDYWACDRSRYI